MSPDEYREFKLEQPVLERWKVHPEGKMDKNFKIAQTGNNNTKK